MRVICVGAIGVLSISCRDSPDLSRARAEATEDLVEIRTSGAATNWQGVLNASGIRVSGNGRVYVADNGDSTIKVFDSTGVFLSSVGHKGRDVPRFGLIKDFVVLGSDIVMLDNAGWRFISVGPDGDLRSIRHAKEREELLGTLGVDRVVVADNTLWSRPVPRNRKSWPLAKVMTPSGDPLFEIGERTSVPNPFAGHIVNFVFPSGTADGKFVWLAFLNSPDVLLYTLAGQRLQRIRREVPFAWQRMPSTFVPKAGQAFEDFVPPFDAISVGIASDTIGRAFILTQMASTRHRKAPPTTMAVDVIGQGDVGRVRRMIFPGAAQHIAVSPSGSRIYLLNSGLSAPRVYRGPR